MLLNFNDPNVKVRSRVKVLALIFYTILYSIEGGVVLESYATKLWYSPGVVLESYALIFYTILESC
jgi:hypothetical protein